MVWNDLLTFSLFLDFQLDSSKGNCIFSDEPNKKLHAASLISNLYCWYNPDFLRRVIFYDTPEVLQATSLRSYIISNNLDDT